MSDEATVLKDTAECPSVLIMAEVRLIQEALAHVIGSDPALSLCGLSSDPMEALAITLTQRPDVILLDASFPEGIGIVGRLQSAVPQVQVIVLAVRETEQNIIAWAEAGVAGYIPNTASLSDVVT